MREAALPPEPVLLPGGPASQGGLRFRPSSDTRGDARGAPCSLAALEIVIRPFPERVATRRRRIEAPRAYSRRVTCFFDAPEFRARLARSGVLHPPGRADPLIREPAPARAADGIAPTTSRGPTSTPSRRRSPARPNSTVARSPLRLEGTRRKRSVSWGPRRALTATPHALAQIPPDPGDDTPSVAQVVGGSLGVADTWHTDPDQRNAFAPTRVPRWDTWSRSAAPDLLALARTARAFEARDGPRRRPTGQAIVRGRAPVVAAALGSRAAHEDITVRQLAERLLAELVLQSQCADWKERRRGCRGSEESSSPAIRRAEGSR